MNDIAVRSIATAGYQSVCSTEALPCVMLDGRGCAYRLYAERTGGSPFGAPRATNRRRLAVSLRT
jgi:homogentisate 1,2-dioxygenase